ncbi:probable purine permease 11 [Cornus florida]|uniref:probable purine permease 11 n=1 Tax=Cornus florida TaxID=4283 RepID=UPI00289DD5AB|nr:probable purine permease 11 [Cornus florida]
MPEKFSLCGRVIFCSMCSAFTEVQEPNSTIGPPVTDQPPLVGLKRWQRWLLVVLNIAFLLIGQSGAVILSRLYYDGGGKSIWMATLIQSAAFPVLFLPLCFFSFHKNHPPTPTIPASPSFRTLSMVYLFLGALLAGDNMLYSIGLLYLPLSTYSLICAAQLAFNAIFSFFINSQKFTMLILNSVILVTLSSCLVAVHSDPTDSNTRERIKGKSTVGFLCTLGASAAYSLLLSLMQFAFEKILKKETFAVVLSMQIYTSLVASCICVVGLFGSGEWRGLREEMEGFGRGSVCYVMTLVGAALAWQVSYVGVVGLIFMVSSLFSNVISILPLPLVPVFAAMFYHENMDGVKVVAMFLAIWGFASYLYQNFLDDHT